MCILYYLLLNELFHRSIAYKDIPHRVLETSIQLSVMIIDYTHIVYPYMCDIYIY